MVQFLQQAGLCTIQGMIEELQQDCSSDDGLTRLGINSSMFIFHGGFQRAGTGKNKKVMIGRNFPPASILVINGQF